MNWTLFSCICNNTSLADVCFFIFQWVKHPLLDRQPNPRLRRRKSLVWWSYTSSTFDLKWKLWPDSRNLLGMRWVLSQVTGVEGKYTLWSIKLSLHTLTLHFAISLSGLWLHILPSASCTLFMSVGKRIPLIPHAFGTFTPRCGSSPLSFTAVNVRQQKQSWHLYIYSYKKADSKLFIMLQSFLLHWC